MRVNKKSWGKRFELFGLVLIVLSACWQFYFTSWFQEQASEWTFMIQRDADRRILLSQEYLANILTTNDPQTKFGLRDSILSNIGDGVNFQENQDSQRKEFYENGQGYYFSLIGFFLTILSAICFVIGKWFTNIAEVEVIKPQKVRRKS